ncbi:CRISPR-associated endonuclease Cas1 [Cylindrospermopsis raciborskii]|uniref:CRISPR-associated endonuclease Cas1 n=1 Tax=Cylindrospermopsis raciborskii TaxID=77022 RepID=UPI000778C317|nr:CRISPR-associated endonuclease Cas1 [Cylindrospermopsis raciborskii]MCZ2203191.1 CRISPR-associated endonuclease Cas1 [Cylindrospermopsis raciborskii PAMP2012]MCZ2207521.1 CRISPR-associated endonuclease Cas1 [Cylindrospermopsis raciborskii PAMP2011]
MQTLYISEQNCYVCLQKETLIVKQGDTVHVEVQLPLLEQILIFGRSQITTQVIRACLWRDIPIAYLSRMGYCYGRILPISRGYRQLSRYQQELSPVDRLITARAIVKGKLKNSRILLRRQRKKRESETLERTLQSLDYLAEQAVQADTWERLMGFEGTGAAQYFSVFSECLTNPDFVFSGRSRRPPGNPVNAMLSFGYQVLWNHLLALIEVQGLDPYYACLHQANDGHAALASDLIEEFRAALVDSLVMWLINRNIMDVKEDFQFKNGGCYLNDSGRKKFLRGFLQRMTEEIQTNDGKQPKWDLLTQQVRNYKQFVYNPSHHYKPYQID